MTDLEDQRVASRRIQDRIGARLRLVYEDVSREPLPDRFADLLIALDRGGAGSRPRRSEDQPP